MQMKLHAGRKSRGWFVGVGRIILNWMFPKLVKMTIDFRKHEKPMSQILIDNTVVKQVESFKFLGSTVSGDPSWGNNTASMVKKAQQHMCLLRKLNKFGISQIILNIFHHAVIESVLTHFSPSLCGLVMPPARRKPSWKHLWGAHPT